MTNPQKQRGDRGEREIAALLNQLTGWPARRKLGAGRQDDTGDFDGDPRLHGAGEKLRRHRPWHT